MITTDAAIAAIHRAAPFMDATWSGAGWKPSEMLRVGYCVLATGRHPDQAEAFLFDMLKAARQRWRAGLPANPFAPEVV